MGLVGARLLVEGVTPPTPRSRRGNRPRIIYESSSSRRDFPTASSPIRRCCASVPKKILSIKNCGKHGRRRDTTTQRYVHVCCTRGARTSLRLRLSAYLAK